MRVVLQRVRSAAVALEGSGSSTESGAFAEAIPAPPRAIGRGLLILLGIGHDDTPSDGHWLAEKIAGLRIFPDEEGRMNRSVRDIAGEVLVVSQFTLLASTRKGTRPSFNDAAPPAQAIPLYEDFLAQMRGAIGREVARGEFGAAMAVSLVNDGPVTIVLDSQRRE